VGEEDPRWIVTERDDGKNVNNWHWAEKDVTSKAKEVLLALLEKSSSSGVSIVNVKDISGEATLINRKKKQCLVYELSCKARFQGMVNQLPVTGNVSFIEIADEVRGDDIDIKITIEQAFGKEQHKKVKNIIIKQFRDIVTRFQVQILEGISMTNLINNTTYELFLRTRNTTKNRKMGDLFD